LKITNYKRCKYREKRRVDFVKFIHTKGKTFILRFYVDKFFLDHENFICFFRMWKLSSSGL